MDEWLGDTESWGMLLGLLSPLAIAVVQQPRWSVEARRVVAGALAVLIGVLTCLATGTLDDGKTVLGTVVLVLVASQAAYASLAHPVARAVEAATSPRPARIPPSNGAHRNLP